MRLLHRIAIRTPQLVGSPRAFLVAIMLVGCWLVWGVFARWSDSWLLWPSAIASVVSFLIVFSIQYTQNRDTRAIQLKLDEILRASGNARNELVKLERLSDDELERLEAELLEVRRGRGATA